MVSTERFDVVAAGLWEMISTSEPSDLELTTETLSVTAGWHDDDALDALQAYFAEIANQAAGLCGPMSINGVDAGCLLPGWGDGIAARATLIRAILQTRRESR